MDLPDLFNNLPTRQEMRIDIPDGELLLIKGFYLPTEADALLHELTTGLQWQEKAIKIFGRMVMQPRLVAWYGEPNAIYSYSGTTFVPKPFTPTLLKIRHHVEQCLNTSFNSTLANLYRNGKDSMGWHSDDERELGSNPQIASLSLGEERVFKLRHKKDKSLKLDVPLPHGSLLVMGGTMQHHWQHALPKSTRVAGPRINLTFRYVQH